MTPAAWGLLGLLAVAALAAWGCACEADRAEVTPGVPAWVGRAWGLLALTLAGLDVVIVVALFGC